MTTLAIQNAYPDFEPGLIKTIEEHATVKHFQTGDVIIRTGQYIQNTMLVLNGKIKVYREDDEGNEFFMYYLMPGQACAISMICATKMETSKIMARVVEDSEVLMVPLNMMEKWMGEFKSWYEFVVTTYRNRFEEVLTVLDQVAFRSMDERLEFYLKRHAENNQSKTIHLSHQEIANELNSSREVISRLLKKMEQRGLLLLNRNSIELLKL
ncbi:MAG: Crp/Fnr family transcriptional regulator [Chitinophagaceae bacterium]